MKSKNELEANFDIKGGHNGIIYVTIFKFENTAEDTVNGLEILLDKVQKMLEEVNEKLILLKFPINDGNEVMINQVKKRVTNFLVRETNIDKIAIVGLKTRVQELLSFLVKFVASGLEIKWFPQEEEAVEWLKHND